MDGSMGDAFEKASEYNKRTRTTQLCLSQPMHRLQTLEDPRRCAGAGPEPPRPSKICGAAAPALEICGARLEQDLRHRGAVSCFVLYRYI